MRPPKPCSITCCLFRGCRFAPIPGVEPGSLQIFSPMAQRLPLAYVWNRMRLLVCARAIHIDRAFPVVMLPIRPGFLFQRGIEPQRCNRLSATHPSLTDLVKRTGFEPDLGIIRVLHPHRINVSQTLPLREKRTGYSSGPLT